jgi:hypothetical protein
MYLYQVRKGELKGWSKQEKNSRKKAQKKKSEISKLNAMRFRVYFFSLGVGLSSLPKVESKIFCRRFWV